MGILMQSMVISMRCKKRLRTKICNHRSAATGRAHCRSTCLQNNEPLKFWQSTSSRLHLNWAHKQLQLGESRWLSGFVKSNQRPSRAPAQEAQENQKGVCPLSNGRQWRSDNNRAPPQHNLDNKHCIKIKPGNYQRKKKIKVCTLSLGSTRSTNGNSRKSLPHHQPWTHGDVNSSHGLCSCNLTKKGWLRFRTPFELISNSIQRSKFLAHSSWSCQSKPIAQHYTTILVRPQL